MNGKNSLISCFFNTTHIIISQQITAEQFFISSTEYNQAITDISRKEIIKFIIFEIVSCWNKRLSMPKFLQLEYKCLWVRATFLLHPMVIVQWYSNINTDLTHSFLLKYNFQTVVSVIIEFSMSKKFSVNSRIEVVVR